MSVDDVDETLVCNVESAIISRWVELFDWCSRCTRVTLLEGILQYLFLLIDIGLVWLGEFFLSLDH